MKKMILTGILIMTFVTGIMGCQSQDVVEGEAQSKTEEAQTTKKVRKKEASKTRNAIIVEMDNIEEDKVETTVVIAEPVTEAESEIESTEEQVIEQEESADTEKFDINALTEEQRNMFYIIDALAVACYDEEYNPNDANFFWNALYMFVAGNPDLWTEPDYEYKWIVERSKLEQYAAGIFEAYNGLPELTTDVTSVQEIGDGYYEFMASDGGLEHSEITSWTVEADGTNKVVVEMIDDLEGDAFAVYEMTLVDNPQLATGSNQIFKYSVRNVERSK